MKVLPFHDYQLIGMLHQDSCTRQIFVYIAMALNIVTYVVSKCTTERVYIPQMNLSNEQYALIKTKTIQSMSITNHYILTT
jgi:hypothetical protein